MMALFKWQAKILNKLYKTNAFQQIILNHSNLQQIDYRNIYHIINKKFKGIHHQNYKDGKYISNINSLKLNNTNSGINVQFISANVIKIAQQNQKKNLQQNIEQKTLEQFIESVNLVCHPTLQSTIVRENIFKLNQIIEKIGYNKNSNQTSSQKSQQYSFRLNYKAQHVIIYSTLSKCKIWPKMLKCSSSLIPELINFYNKFTKDFQYDLSYKFDPVILTHKYQKVMNKIQEKKKSFPQLFIAIQKNDIQIIKKMMNVNYVLNGSRDKQERQNFINQCKKDNYHVSHYAVIHSSLEIIKMLYYDYKIDFQQTDNQQQTALFYAVKRNSFQIVKFLVEQVKVNINHKEYQNRTPIYLGAFQGNLKIVDYLYKKGANPEMESKLSRTPLSKACYLGNISVADYLIKIGVNLTTIDSKGRTALHNAAWGIQGGRQGKKRGNLKLEDSPECAKLLLQAGHPIDIQDFDGFTPLMSAAASLAIKSLHVLIKYGANLKHKTKRNQTVVFVAAKYGHLQSLRILIEQYNCEYEQQNCHGISPLDASFTTIDSKTQVSFYLLDLYYKNGKVIDFQKLIKCLCYYKKQANLQQLIKWSEGDEKKRKYIIDNLYKYLQENSQYMKGFFNGQIKKMTGEGLVNISNKNLNKDKQNYQQNDQINDQSSSNNDNSTTAYNQNQIYIYCYKDILPYFLNLITLQIQSIPFQILQLIIDNSIESYKKGQFSYFIEFLFKNHQILQKRGIQIKNLQIQAHTKQEDIIKILSINTNLTQSNKSVYRLMLFLVKRRMTKVLIWILTLHQNQNSQLIVGNVIKKGMHRFSKQTIQQIVKEQTNQQNSIENYCYIHGIHDAVKILQLQNSSQKQQFKLKVYIPEYQYSFTRNQNSNPIGTLLPVKQKYFDFRYLITQHLSEEQTEFYTSSLKEYNKKLTQEMIESIHIIQDLEGLNRMKKHFENCKILGIDIEHFSNNSNEEFICLIQIFGMGYTFILDMLSLQKSLVRPILQQIFQSEQKIKIFHSYDQDLKWITQDFGIQIYKSIVDTSKMYSIFNPKQKSPSLKLLAQTILFQKISKDYQRSDWRIRPLFKQMKIYAGTDALLLPFIYLKQLMDEGVEIDNQRDKIKVGLIKKQFGAKRYIKSKGRKNQLKIINRNVNKNQ